MLLRGRHSCFALLHQLCDFDLNIGDGDSADFLSNTGDNLTELNSVRLYGKVFGHKPLHPGPDLSRCRGFCYAFTVGNKVSEVTYKLLAVVSGVWLVCCSRWGS
jgi:hypothetical protein